MKLRPLLSSIRFQVLLAPLLILLAVNLVLGFTAYRLLLQAHIDHELELARVGAQPLINLMTKAIGGGNYAIAQDEEALALFKANRRARFFAVSGRTDRKGEPFGLVFDPASGSLIRAHYPPDYARDLRARLRKAERMLAGLAADHPRRGALERIRTRIAGELARMTQARAKLRHLQEAHTDPFPPGDGPARLLDRDHWRLYLRVPTANPGGGHILAELDASALAGLWKTTLARILPPVSVVLSLSLLALWWIARGLLRPMHSFVGTIHEIERSGDLSLRTRLGIDNELGEVGRAFDSMLGRFQGSLREVSTAADRLATASESLASVSGDVQTQAAGQLHDIQEVAEAMGRLAANAREASESTATAADEARSADAEAEQGRVLMGQVVERVRGLASRIDSAADTVQRLAVDTDNIGGILEVIQGIADQTNLLALNAAIEAARAGEQGRGFAVVADEVRALAGRTRESVTEIQGMIESLQDKAREVVQEIHGQGTVVHDSVEQAQNADAALQQIDEAISAIHHEIEAIRDKLAGQSATTQQVDLRVNAIHEAAEQTNQGVERNAEVSGEVARAAEDLEGLVRRFKV